MVNDPQENDPFDSRTAVGTTLRWSKRIPSPARRIGVHFALENQTGFGSLRGLFLRGVRLRVRACARSAGRVPGEGNHRGKGRKQLTYRRFHDCGLSIPASDSVGSADTGGLAT